ncbi:MAG: hypothetical protein BWY15_00051 [Firmicutes bacterium ADurb.Bin193]|nr:MAG: hypothetical protein BWY15_00051 [Firmicutes bacterium ADurb.Bin193]
MKKRIILTISLVALLAAVYWAVMRLPSIISESEKPPTESEPVILFETDADNIVSMTISTPEFKYSFVKPGGVWKVEGAQDLKLNLYAVENLAYDFSRIYAESEIGDTADLSAFGFDSPVGNPSVKLSDGSVKTFLIGGETPDLAAYYVKTDDSNRVYVVLASKCEAFLKPLDKYRDTTLAQIKASEIEAISIKKMDSEISLRKKPADTPVPSGVLSNSWEMLLPYKKDADDTKVDKYILSKIVNFEINRFIDDSPPSYSPYGLDNPKYVITIKEKGKEAVVFYLGNTKDGETFVRLEGQKAVYTVAESVFAFRDVIPGDIIDTLLYIKSLDIIKSVTLTAGDKTYVLEIEKSEDKTVYKINGADASEKSLKSAYQSVIGLMIRGSVTEEVKGELLCKIVFSFNNGNPNDIIEINAYKDRYAAVSVNNKADYYVMKESVFGMLQKLDEISRDPAKQ